MLKHRLSLAGISLMVVMLMTALLPATSHAANFTTTYHLDGVTIDGAVSLNQSFKLNANQFDPANGILKSITISWSVTLDAMATDEAGHVGDGFGGSMGGPVSLNGESYIGFGVSFSGAGIAAGVPFTASGTGGVTDTLRRAVNISPGAFDSAIGTGTVPLEFDPAGSVGSSPFVTDISTTSSATVTVTYSTVPLPKSLSMSFLGLGMLGMLQLAKKAKVSSALRAKLAA